MHLVRSEMNEIYFMDRVLSKEQFCEHLRFVADLRAEGAYFWAKPIKTRAGKVRLTRCRLNLDPGTEDRLFEMCAAAGFDRLGEGD
jgi:hypothetical protein